MNIIVSCLNPTLVVEPWMPAYMCRTTLEQSLITIKAYSVIL